MGWLYARSATYIRYRLDTFLHSLAGTEGKENGKLCLRSGGCRGDGNTIFFFPSPHVWNLAKFDREREGTVILQRFWVKP